MATSERSSDNGPDANWRGLYRAGGAAALLAGILFRRNLAAEIHLFGGPGSPVAASDWFALLQSNRLLGLAYLNVFDPLNYTLLALTFLALYVVLRKSSRGSMVVATALGLIGIAVYLASSTAFSILALSEQYAAAVAEAQQASLRAAGEALLARNPFTIAGGHPGSGYISMLLVALAGLVFSRSMLRGKLFGRPTAIFGLIANGLDLAYCLAYVLLPAADSETLALIFLPAAGLFYMIWHIMIGRRLSQLGRG